MVDRYLHELDAAGAALVVTADHGMKPKHGPDGSPEVLYLQDALDEWLGVASARVILPITDPYVVHHGSLGSFATAYLPATADAGKVISDLLSLDMVETAVSGDEAASRFDLPRDRIGDLVVISTENAVLGTSRHRHQLEALDAPLRSHGGLSEQVVPFIVNRPIDLDETGLRNFDAFHIAGARGAERGLGWANREVFLEETMRIAGESVGTDGTIPVHYPYTGEVIGTVPQGRAEHARKAFDIAAGYQTPPDTF